MDYLVRKHRRFRRDTRPIAHMALPDMYGTCALCARGGGQVDPSSSSSRLRLVASPYCATTTRRASRQHAYCVECWQKWLRQQEQNQRQSSPSESNPRTYRDRSQPSAHPTFTCPTCRSVLPESMVRQILDTRLPCSPTVQCSPDEAIDGSREIQGYGAILQDLVLRTGVPPTRIAGMPVTKGNQHDVGREREPLADAVVVVKDRSERIEENDSEDITSTVPHPALVADFGMQHLSLHAARPSEGHDGGSRHASRTRRRTSSSTCTDNDDDDDDDSDPNISTTSTTRHANRSMASVGRSTSMDGVIVDDDPFYHLDAGNASRPALPDHETAHFFRDVCCYFSPSGKASSLSLDDTEGSGDSVEK